MYFVTKVADFPSLTTPIRKATSPHIRRESPIPDNAEAVRVRAAVACGTGDVRRACVMPGPAGHTVGRALRRRCPNSFAAAPSAASTNCSQWGAWTSRSEFGTTPNSKREQRER